MQPTEQGERMISKVAGRTNAPSRVSEKHNNDGSLDYRRKFGTRVELFPGTLWCMYTVGPLTFYFFGSSPLLNLSHRKKVLAPSGKAH